MDSQSTNLENNLQESNLKTEEQTNKGGNHWIMILSVALFVLLSFSVVAFLYYQNQQLKEMLAGYQKSTSSPKPTDNNSSLWKSYSNSIFSFEYPGNYSIKNTNDEEFIILESNNQDNDEQIYINWRSEEFADISINQLISDLNKTSEIKSQNKIVNGVDLIIVENSKLGGQFGVANNEVRMVVLDSKNKRLIQLTTLPKQDNDLKNFDKIIESFKFVEKQSSPTPEPKACTLEAKLCSDGSYVGRTGPNCEFSACPTPTP